MRQHENLARLVLVSVSVALPILLFLGVREALFFDRFYYQKSMDHGYWPEGARTGSFGPRTADIDALSRWIQDHPEAIDAPPSSGPDRDPDLYTVAVIGDSFVFGQGLRQRDRYPVHLQALLDARAPTQVLSLGLSGDSLLDDYLKYHWLMRQGRDVDLVVFGVVNNDLLLNEDRYDPVLGKRIEAECAPQPLYRDPIDGSGGGLDVPFETHLQRASDAERYGNVCVFEHLVARYLPTERVFYFDYGDPYRGVEFQPIRAALVERGLVLVDASRRLREELPRKSRGDLRSYVSMLDRHPSKAANRVFADVLFKEITTDPRWGFPALETRPSQ